MMEPHEALDRVVKAAKKVQTTSKSLHGTYEELEANRKLKEAIHVVSNHVDKSPLDNRGFTIVPNALMDEALKRKMMRRFEALRNSPNRK